MKDRQSYTHTHVHACMHTQSMSRTFMIDCYSNVNNSYGKVNKRPNGHFDGYGRIDRGVVDSKVVRVGGLS